MSYRDKRWHHYEYSKKIIKFEKPMFGLEIDVELEYDVHTISSARSLWRLFSPIFVYKQGWSLITCDRETTRWWIEHGKTNIFLPGLNYQEFCKEYDTDAILTVAVPTNDNIMDLDAIWVAFREPKAAMVWKLTQ